jgi:hypothetical protein
LELHHDIPAQVNTEDFQMKNEGKGLSKLTAQNSLLLGFFIFACKVHQRLAIHRKGF